ncbi:hypothetical protein BH23THE1_BH23THE1_18760 [soil metagenome]
MYFDKSFSYLFVLPFVQDPFASIGHLYTSAVNCYHYVVFSDGFTFGSWFIFILATLLHQIVVKSGTTSLSFFIWIDIILRKPSNLIDGMEVGTHVRWRAAISRSSDIDSEDLPFLRSFSLALLLASSVKNLNQTTFRLV